MSVTAEPELLFPLTWFHRQSGAALPACTVVEAEEMPQPYRGLLVHTGDMTSRLESFHGGPLVLTVLHREQTEEAYRREVVLRLAEGGRPVEYGAIEIMLEAFSPELRAKILEEHLPLGGLLNAHGMEYYSRPRAFLRLGADDLLARLFGTRGAQEFYGRSNELWSAGEERLLARIVEVLPP